jgi:hypothetical protein
LTQDIHRAEAGHRLAAPEWDRPDTYTTARGRLVLDADGETVKFVPVDPEELAVVIAADEA